MSDAESSSLSSAEEIIKLVELMEMDLMGRGIKDLAEHVLSNISGIMQSSSAVLYIVDSQLYRPHFFQHGFLPHEVAEIEKLCSEQFNTISNKSDFEQVSIQTSLSSQEADKLIVYPLRTEKACIGLIGLTVHENVITSDLLERLLRLIATAFTLFSERVKSERQLSNLNKYLTVSSMIAQSLDLHELLEITLQCCMEAVSAEAASILLLDDEKKNFCFYTIEGPAKPVLMSATFPADKGIAGSVLQSQQSEIIQDVHKDPRFYKNIDSESGFHTRNMIVIPLAAGEEKVGVLEVLNKSDGDSFTEEEHLFMLMIGEEIAFAVRNAKMFEYVVNSYCRQHQGQASCKGCERPLGTWTPCVKYRENGI